VGRLEVVVIDHSPAAPRLGGEPRAGFAGAGSDLGDRHGVRIARFFRIS
jgi:hypothetical protein